MNYVTDQEYQVGVVQLCVAASGGADLAAEAWILSNRGSVASSSSGVEFIYS